MLDWWEKNFATCELGERRLNERAFVFWQISLKTILADCAQEKAVLKAAVADLLPEA